MSAAATIETTSKDDILTTIKVIGAMREKLLGQGININNLLQVLEQEKNGTVLDSDAAASKQIDLITDGFYQLNDLGELFKCTKYDQDTSNNNNIEFASSDKIEQLTFEDDYVYEVLSQSCPSLTEIGTTETQNILSSDGAIPQTGNEQDQVSTNKALQSPNLISPAETFSQTFDLSSQVDSAQNTFKVVVATSQSSNPSDQAQSNVDLEMECPETYMGMLLAGFEQKTSLGVIAETSILSQHSSSSPIQNDENTKNPTPSISKPISNSFKKHLTYPKPIGMGIKRKAKVKTPNAISAPEWRKIYETVEAEKRVKAEEILKRKDERIEKAKIKAEAIEKRKMERIEKAKNKAEQTLKRLEDKMKAYEPTSQL